MEIRTRKNERARGLILALVFIAPALLAGCTTSPRTAFEWGVNDRIHKRIVVASRKNYPQQSYTYRDDATPRVTPKPRPEPAWYQDTARPVTHDVVIDTPASVGDLRFAWPLNGRVISYFGSTANGERNDGINIAAAIGEPIHAAADGTVSYAGNDLKSYGNLVLIRHGDNYVTAYAHADRILVNRGDHVVKGQIIGYAGDTGDVSFPQLHFEIRRGVTPINPRPLMVASR